MAVDSVSVSKPKQSKSQKTGNVTPSSPASAKGGLKSPEIRVVGGRIYDSVNGKTCHQCRQKTRDFAAACQNQRNNKPCTIMLCRKCLLNRYGEKAEEVTVLGDWSCPKCRGICNCSVCMKKRGHQPTGALASTAKATGFSSVSEMLLKGAVNSEKHVTDMASPKKEVVLSPRKRGKENSIDGKVDVNIPSPVDSKSKKVKGVVNGNTDDNTSSKRVHQVPDKRKLKQDGLLDMLDYNRNAGVSPEESSLQGCEKKPKKMKHDGLDEMIKCKNDKEKKISVHDEKQAKKPRSDGLEENGDSKKKNAILARRTSPRKLNISNKMSKEGVKLNVGVDLEENVNTVTKKDLAGSFENDKNKGGNNADDNNFVKHLTADFRADIVLPLGRELTNVAGIDVCAEDVGSALQFLEFCAVFGKATSIVALVPILCFFFGLILEVKKGQPEYVLKDLLHGRTGRRGKFSLTVQFHIHLLSIIQTEQGEECTPLSPSYGKHSWYNALKKSLSESQSVLKAQELDSLETVVDYETLDASKKLRILNFLCDEVLQTEKVRTWIDNQNTALSDKVKEAKQKVVAAKDKEKSLKQKLKDDIAKAVIAKNGANLSISEHDGIVSKIRAEAAQAHANVLESEAMILNNKQTCDAVRIEPLFIGGGGDVYWKLNCYGKSDVLRQNVGKVDALISDEKWSAIDHEGKETIEKHICSLRGKRLRAPKVSNILQS
ncbi:hypothetical protein BUALT_Bualt04G0079400 [Buddleja alternifolia]|uniref:Cell division cycle-associated 7-like protein n=1 Tax=Buddleja alternifolia TaxID=168488 RepID=A0AAV6XM68_9LAMI|nr:hypothetical protein BUALT_Bualt04G0079400 [Buddleja alternifolia]